MGFSWHNDNPRRLSKLSSGPVGGFFLSCGFAGAGRCGKSIASQKEF
jgi:hypothetical protein